MKTIIQIGNQKYLLKSLEGIETVIKCLSEAKEVSNTYKSKPSYIVREVPNTKITVEVMDDNQVEEYKKPEPELENKKKVVPEDTPF